MTKSIRLLLLISPMVLLLIAAFVMPMLNMIAVSFSSDTGAVHADSLSLKNYMEFFTDGYYLGMVAESIRVSVVSTVVTISVSYIVAFYLSRTAGWERTIILAVCLLPLFVNIVVGILGWYILLLPFGFVQQMAASLGIVTGPLRAFDSFFTLVFVLTFEHLPFGILILSASLQNVPQDRIRAAQCLGAGPMRILRTVLIPLTMPGILASTVLVFSLTASSYLVPVLITGDRFMVLPLGIFTYTNQLLNWPMAAVMAVTLLVFVFSLSYTLTRLGEHISRRGKWEIA